MIHIAVDANTTIEMALTMCHSRRPNLCKEFNFELSYDGWYKTVILVHFLPEAIWWWLSSRQEILAPFSSQHRLFSNLFDFTHVKDQEEITDLLPTTK